MNSRGLSRGVQQGAVHQGAVVAVLDQVVSLAGVAALLRPVGNLDLHGVFGVVEINDVDVKDENGRAGNEISCSRRERENYQDRVTWVFFFFYTSEMHVWNSPTPSPPYAR